MLIPLDSDNCTPAGGSMTPFFGAKPAGFFMYLYKSELGSNGYSWTSCKVTYKVTSIIQGQKYFFN